MNRTLSSLAVLGLCTLAASAVQAQSMPDVSRNPKGTAAPFNGTAEEAYVKEQMRAAGYTGVNSLERDSDGVWRARAYKGPADVLLAYDHAGHVSEAVR